MIDEKAVADLKRMVKGQRTAHEPDKIDAHLTDQMFETLEELWEVARAARRWFKAMPGKESSEAENELDMLCRSLPNDPKGNDA